MISQDTLAWGQSPPHLAIVLFALATFFNLMGGIGTSCVALNPTGLEPEHGEAGALSSGSTSC